MLVLAIHDLRRLLRVADITAAMSVEALLGTDRAFAEDLVALRPQDGQAASAANLRSVLAGSPIVASHRYDDDRVQDAYSLRCAPQVNGAARDTLAHAERVARGRARLRDRQPDGAARRPRRVVRQLPRRAARVRARLPRDRGRRGRRRSPSAAPTGCSTRRRSHGLPPFLTPDAGRQLRADDRPVHAGGDGGREPAAGGARERRLAPDQRDAGGSRVDGLVGRAQAAHRARQPRAHPRRRADVRRARARPARAAAAGRRRRPRRWRWSARASTGRGPTGRSRPTWRRPRSW